MPGSGVLLCVGAASIGIAQTSLIPFTKIPKVFIYLDTLIGIIADQPSRQDFIQLGIHSHLALDEVARP
jgi:hypothetical protein